MNLSKVKLTYVIDDDEVIKYLTQLLFKKMHFTEKAEFYTEPTSALCNLKNLKDNSESLPDLILLDLRMPNMTGWQFLEEFENLSLSKEIPIFIFSSSINEDDVIRSKKYKNVQDYIIKPLTVHKVNKIIRQMS